MYAGECSSVTFERAGTSGPCLTRRDVQAIDQALIAHAERSATAGQGANGQ